MLPFLLVLYVRVKASAGGINRVGVVMCNGDYLWTVSSRVGSGVISPSDHSWIELWIAW